MQWAESQHRYVSQGRIDQVVALCHKQVVVGTCVHRPRSTSALCAGYWVQGSGGSFFPGATRRGNGRQCPSGMYCTEYGNPNNGFTSYDNIMWAWLTIFQCITEEGWTDDMYYTQDAVSYWVWPYYVSIIVLGAFFLMNLALVVLYVQVSHAQSWI
jgi:hypothetical protein